MTSSDAVPGTEMQAETPRREYPRALFSVPLQLRHIATGRLQSIHGMTLDISAGGLGAIVRGNLEIGEAVEINLDLGKRSLNTVAIVRHASDTRCGMEFLG